MTLCNNGVTIIIYTKLVFVHVYKEYDFLFINVTLGIVFQFIQI